MTVVGEALVDLLLQAFGRQRPQVRRAIEWISDAGCPPAGVRLVTDDGTQYTGLVLFEANRPRLMFALRVGVRPNRPSLYQRESRYSRHEFDDELWSPDSRTFP